MQSVKIDDWPWNDKDVRHDMGSMSDANLVWFDGDDAILFHATTEEASDAILKNGAIANSFRIGFFARKQQKAFWCNCVPYAADGIEAWLPRFDKEPLTFLKVTVPRSVLSDSYHFEPSWPFCQFAIQPKDIKDISLLPANEFTLYRSYEDMKKLKEWCEEEGKNDYIADACVNMIVDTTVKKKYIPAQGGRLEA